MTLGRCSDCLLLFRSPTDTPIQSFTFYQKDYTEESVTELPGLRQLAELKAAGFSSKGDLTPYLTLMKQFYGDRGSKLVDYGCSWGYNTWRFQSEGFVSSGVEVSRTRCDYGRKELGVDLHYSADQLPSDFDIFFSSHVFEHVPSPAKSFNEARRLLGDKGGLCIIITPNGCDAFRKARPRWWHELWGRKHPNFLDDQFWKRQLAGIPHVLMSRSEDGSVPFPVECLTHAMLEEMRPFDLSGDELVVVAWLPKQDRCAQAI